MPAGFRGPDYSPFTGPAVAASGYVPASYSAPVRGTKRFATLDYSVGSGNQRAAASIASAGGGGLFAADGVKAAAHELFGYPTWRDGAAVNALRVDGRTAYTAADIPLFSFGAETASTPAGFEGLQSNVALDPATGALTVSESQRIFRCDRTDDERPEEEDCASVLDTGIRHERTITLTRQHSVADVRDRWISSDGRPHQIVAQYSAMSQEAKAEAPEWRFPGDTAFRPQAEIDLMPTGPGDRAGPRRRRPARSRRPELHPGSRALPLRARGRRRRRRARRAGGRRRPGAARLRDRPRPRGGRRSGTGDRGWLRRPARRDLEPVRRPDDGRRERDRERAGDRQHRRRRTVGQRAAGDRRGGRLVQRAGRACARVE